MLFDRDGEIARLSRAVTDAAAGRGSLLVITGPIGAGRTALLDAVRPQAAREGAHVVEAVAARAERAFPAGVLRQLAEPLAADLTAAERDRVAAGIADFLHPVFANGEATPRAGYPASASHAVLHGFRHLVSVAGGRRPLVLVVDDLQWADVESLRCLAYLVHRLDGLRVAVVVAVRDGLPRSGSESVRAVVQGAADVLALRPLSSAGVRGLVREVFGEDGGDRFAAACLEVSRGVPLIARAVVDELAESGVRPVDDAVREVLACLPAQLCEWYGARLAEFPGAVRSYAVAAGLLGDAAEPELIGELTRLDPAELAAAARALHAAGVVVPDRFPRFVHPVAREAVLRALDAADEEGLHVAAAKALHRAGRPAEEVAAHLLAVPSFQDVWVVDSLRDAARAAVRRGARDQAARVLRRALFDTPVQTAQRGELLVELAEVESAATPVAATRHLLEALPLLRSATARATTLVRAATTCLRAAPDEFADAARAVLADDVLHPELRLRVEARLFLITDDDPRRLADAVRRAQGADPRALAATSGGRELSAVLLRAAALTGRSSRDDVVRDATLLMREMTPEDPRLPDTAALLTEVFVLADRPLDAAPLSTLAAQYARDHQVPDAAAIAVASALRLLAQGLAGQADDLLASVGREPSTTGTTTALLLGAAVLQLPDPRRAHHLLRTDPERPEHPAETALGQALRALDPQGDEPASTRVERLLDCGRRLERAGWANPAVLAWRTHAATLLHGLGDTDAALALVDAELTAARTWGGPVAIGRALRALGSVLPDEDAAVRSTREALEVLRRTDHRWEVALTEAQLARALQRSRPEEAAALAARARAAAAECGIRQPADQVPAGHPAPTPGRSTALTRAELRVARWAAEGRTNQDIAEELDVSSRAVEKHLTSVYRKLGLSGRTALAAALDDYGA
ncbi:helix-turn-helix transcriptional regulator [Saccharothrix longispora]|uniref:helix-turn-helix transcriptional regulator n=1 Tax=Saccharothrix longispora TaxID=33920 RepID=UPI0028FD6881|nr:AAA family ATPase [Saccharothrix longispora]MBY8848768.1 AAA family ATPase [Saccharothrix sp. MB29]MDU0288970.1 AAA family ATPase [Saccharothrix longispora]